MSGLRQNKVGRLIHREIAEILRARGGSLSDGGMLTVTAVRMTPDLGLAKVYLSIFAAKDKEAAMKKVKAHTGELRNELGKKVRNQLRKIPELAFYLDDSLDQAERIDDLLKK